MTRPSSRHSGGPTIPIIRQAHPGNPPPHRWWNRISKSIVAAGAIAAAITAVLTLVLSLLPKHSPQNIARFISVQPLSQVPLSEYPRRSAVFKLQSAGHPQEHGRRLMAAFAGQSSSPSIQDGSDTTSPPSSPTTAPQPSPSVSISTSTQPSSPTSAASPTATGSSTGTATPACTDPATGMVTPTCTASPTETGSPTGTGPPTGTGSPTGTGPPTGSGSPASGVKSLLPLGMSSHQAVAYTSSVIAIVQKREPGLDLSPCGDSPCVAYVLHTTCLTQNGRALPVPMCADTLAGMFGDGATAPVGPAGQGNGGSGSQGASGSGNQGNGGSGNQGNGGSGNQGNGGSGIPANGGSGNQGNGGSGIQGGSGSGIQGSSGPGNQGNGPGHKRQPLGELIGVNLELAGLQGQPVYLSWSIFQQSGTSHLSEKWLGNFVAYRLEATTNDDTGTLEMWVPLPKHRGPYFIRLTLSTGSASLASMNSGPFY